MKTIEFNTMQWQDTNENQVCRNQISCWNKKWLNNNFILITKSHGKLLKRMSFHLLAPLPDQETFFAKRENLVWSLILVARYEDHWFITLDTTQTKMNNHTSLGELFGFFCPLFILYSSDVQPRNNISKSRRDFDFLKKNTVNIIIRPIPYLITQIISILWLLTN